MHKVIFINSNTILHVSILDHLAEIYNTQAYLNTELILIFSFTHLNYFAKISTAA